MAKMKLFDNKPHFEALHLHVSNLWPFFLI